MSLTAVDLFAGGGGMSLGFSSAGVRIKAAVEKDPVAARSYRLNFPKHPLLVEDLTTVTNEQLYAIAGNVDIIFGGPPCQGFSQEGNRDPQDSRNSLVWEFARVVQDLRPRYFVMENVVGLQQKRNLPLLRKLLDFFHTLGYDTGEPLILNALDFGVAQQRRRLFIIGAAPGNKRPLPPVPHRKRPTVRDALQDLPEIECYPELWESDEVVADFDEPSEYAIALNGGYLPSRRLITASGRTEHSLAVQERFMATPANGREPVSRFKRLDWDGYAPTLKAGTGSDKGRHTSTRPIHPDRPRCITVREGARLHSFPDWFRFDPTVLHGFRQVGNAVPPLLAKALAETFFLTYS